MSVRRVHAQQDRRGATFAQISSTQCPVSARDNVTFSFCNVNGSLFTADIGLVTACASGVPIPPWTRINLSIVTMHRTIASNSRVHCSHECQHCHCKRRQLHQRWEHRVTPKVFSVTIDRDFFVINGCFYTMNGGSASRNRGRPGPRSRAQATPLGLR